jgi:dCTP deaminase
VIAGGNLLRTAHLMGELKVQGPGALPIDPAIGPNSIDLTLNKRLLIPRAKPGFVVRRDTVLTRDDYDEVVMDETGHDLMPGQSLLASTNERIDVSGMAKPWVPMYDGRSTVGRLFILSHVSAGFGDYGFCGHWTLEIVNLGVWGVELFPGMRIGQTFFHEALMPTKYQGSYPQLEPGPQIPRTGPGRL